MHKFRRDCSIHHAPCDEASRGLVLQSLGPTRKMRWRYSPTPSQHGGPIILIAFAFPVETLVIVDCGDA